MLLTSAQATTLKNAITSDASVSSFVSQANWFAIAGVYNSPTTTQIWRTDITPAQLLTAIVGSEAVKQSAQQLQLAQLVLTEPLIDATNLVIRAQFGAMFPASSCVSTSANLTTVAQRPATKFENLFVTSLVSTVYGYTLSPGDVQNAMGF